jgi:hypothetical protein
MQNMAPQIEIEITFVDDLKEDLNLSRYGNKSCTTTPIHVTL